jgi:nitrogen fixation/metabolism regulation signal transduction histidine kinase
MAMRKQFIVNKKFQYSFIMKNILFLLFCFLLLYISVHVWEKKQTDQGFLLRPPTNEQVMTWAKQNNVPTNSVEFASAYITQAEVYTFFELLSKPIIIVAILNILFLVLFNIYYSNKIAGPLYRLKRNVDKKLNGESVYPVKFRHKDEFQELADSINKLMFEYKEQETKNTKEEEEKE